MLVLLPGWYCVLILIVIVNLFKLGFETKINMVKHVFILTALAFLVAGCATPVEEQDPPKSEPVASMTVKKDPIPKNVVKKSIATKMVDRKNEGEDLCKNIKTLKKGMTLEDVHNQLVLGKNKKYSFTKPLFYVKCYEADMMISYAQFKFYFDEGCIFRKYYEPDEKEIEEKICSGNTEKLAPPEIFKY